MQRTIKIKDFAKKHWKEAEGKGKRARERWGKNDDAGNHIRKVISEKKLRGRIDPSGRG